MFGYIFKEKFRCLISSPQEEHVHRASDDGEERDRLQEQNHFLQLLHLWQEQVPLPSRYPLDTPQGDSRNQTDITSSLQTDRQTGRQAGRQAGRQNYLSTDRHAGR